MDWILDKNGNIVVSRAIGIAIASFIVLGTMWGSFYVVDAGEEAVIFDAGTGVKEQTFTSGFHLKTPWLQDVIKYNVQTQLYHTPAEAASKDLQDVQSEVALNYHADASWAWWLHKNYGYAYAAKVIPPAVQEVVKACTARYNADQLIEQRPAVKDCITTGLTLRLAEIHVSVDQVSITNFEFSEQFNNAIEAKVTAQQRALEEKNKLDQITYQAQQQIITAQATANATILAAQAQAEAAHLISQSLEQNPRYIDYLMAQRWDGHLPQTYVGDGNFTALLNVGAR